MRRNLIIATYLAVVGVSGCAFTTDRIELQYNQQAGITPIKGAQDVSVTVQVVDQRQEKSKVSSKKNGFGMETAPIIPVEDVTITIRRAIEQELRARGFQLGADTAIISVSADLTRFYNDHKLGFFAGDAVADLNMFVIAKARRGDLLYAKQIVAQGLEPNTQLMTGENARLALNKALETGIRYLFEDQAFLSALVSVAGTKEISR